MSLRAILKEMQELATENSYFEEVHSEADKLLCETVRLLAYSPYSRYRHLTAEKILIAYKKVGKWYA